VEFRLLGPVAVVADDGTVAPVPGARLSTLVAVLLCNAGRSVPADRLVDVLWGDNPPGGATNALQKLVSNLRRLVPAELVEWNGTGYRLAVERDAVDMHRFEDMAARGRAELGAGDTDDAAQTLRTALALWQGAPLAGVDDSDFAHAERTRLDELRANTVEDRIDADLACGQGSELVGELEALVTEHPLRERRRGQLMLALYRAGRQADALRAYQDARETLLDELGIDPSPALRELEAQILSQDESLGGRTRRRATERVTGNVRSALTPLVGRERELGLIDDAVSEARFVTLVGPGGSGKTRLAIELAPRVQDRFPHGVWMIELAGVLDPAMVLAAITTALSIVETPGETRQGIDRVVEYLENKEVLLVLDNCEHVVTEAARVVEHLLTGTPAVRVLATSREGLGLPGEHLLPIPPLPTDDAVKLFVQRAAGVADAASESQKLVAEICERLDGMPLAIELAAARTRALPLPELAKRLDQRFRLLTGGPRTALPRQQTLQAVVDWSYDLLFEDERRVFERLAAFAGGATLDAAEYVCSDDDVPRDEVAEVVARLVDKSLVIANRAGDAAYYQLLQTLAHYGREKLAIRPEVEAVRMRHLEYYAEFCKQGNEAFFGPSQPQWILDARRDLDEIRVSVEWALEHDHVDLALTIAGSIAWFFWVSGRAEEGFRLLERGCARPGDIDTHTRGRALMWLTWLGGLAGQPLAYERLAEEAAAMCLESEDESLAVLAAFMMGEVLLGHGFRERGTELMAQARDLSDAVADADPIWKPTSVHIAARTAALTGNGPEAERLYAEAAQGHAGRGDRFGEVMATSQLAELMQIRGAYEEAARVLEAAYAIAEEMDVTGSWSYFASRVAHVKTLLGEYEDAAEWHEQALEKAVEAGFGQMAAFTHNSIATRLRLQGDFDGALAAAQRAREIYESADLVLGLTEVYATLGAIAVDRDDTDEADRCYRAALAAARRSDRATPVATALEGMADVASRRGDAAGAAARLGHAHALRSAVGSQLAGMAAIAVDRVTRDATEVLGPDAFTAAFQAGAEADLDALTA
jgi:predicted ATPase/DNA-binding SARP family transcriptional activator